MKVVHLKAVPDDRRDRARERKREQILDAAESVLASEGLSGLTMAALAEQLDCAIGTLYLYFASKDDLLGALEERAVKTLEASFATAARRWEPELADDELPDDLAALVRLVAFDAFWSAAAVVFADEITLVRDLLATRPPVVSRDERQEIAKRVDALLAIPAELLQIAVDADAIEPGDGRERALRWVAALNGILAVDNLAPVDRRLFRGPHLARQASLDMLVGWGADRGEVEVADTHVDRLAASGPMAPPPELAGFT